MKKTYLTSIFCTFAFILSHNTFAANDCAYFSKPPVVRLRGTYGKLKYDNTHNTLQLSAIASRNKLREINMFAAGLADISVFWQVKLRTQFYPRKDYECAVAESIDIVFGYRNPVIYISKDLKPDTCLYNVVLRHEQQHQQINLEVLDFYLPTLKKEFIKQASVLKARQILPHEDSKAVTDEMTQIYSEAIRPIIERFQISLQIEQNRLDNFKNYSYEENLCRKH